MGFTSADVALFDAWAVYPRARAHMVDFVNSVADALLDALRDELAVVAPRMPRDALAALSTRGKVKRVVTPRLGKVDVTLRIPTDGAERISAGLWGWDDPRFFVEVPFPAVGSPDRARRKASIALKECGFGHWRERSFVRQLPLTEDLLRAPDLPERVVRFAGECFRGIAQSGILAFEPAPPRSEEADTA
jgi:hypothetical protein